MRVRPSVDVGFCSGVRWRRRCSCWRFRRLYRADRRRGYGGHGRLRLRPRPSPTQNLETESETATIPDPIQRRKIWGGESHPAPPAAVSPDPSVEVCDYFAEEYEGEYEGEGEVEVALYGSVIEFHGDNGFDLKLAPEYLIGGECVCVSRSNGYGQ